MSTPKKDKTQGGRLPESLKPENPQLEQTPSKVEHVPAAIIKSPYDWFWIVKYQDGSELNQYNEDWSENKIDLRDVYSVRWVPFEQTRQTFEVVLEEGQKPIIARRTYLPQGRDSSTVRIVYLIGASWKDEETGETRREITYFSPSFTVILPDPQSGEKKPITFVGMIEKSGQKDFVNALDRWVKTLGYLFTGDYENQVAQNKALTEEAEKRESEKKT